MKKILIVVDYQYDFVAQDGALPVPNADKIYQNIQNRIDSDEYQNTIYTLDTHTPKQYNGSEEQKLFPNIHCEYNTKGWNFYKIKPIYNTEFQESILNDIEPFNYMKINNECFFTKDVFDIWSGNEKYPDWFVEKFPADEYEVDVVGVAYEFCVNFNIQGMLDRDYKVNLINNCVSSITTNGEKDTYNILSAKGLNFK